MFNRMILSIFNSKALKPWIAVFVVFVIFELCFRVSTFGFAAVLNWSQYSPQSLVYLDYIEPNDDSVLQWKMKPNVSGYLKGAAFKTNSLGFRDDEFRRTGQIIALGRSVTMGEGVNFEETWSSLLEQKLIENHHGINEVQNMAVSAYSLLQVERNFSLYGRSLKPKIVILPIFIEEWDSPIIPENYKADFSFTERIGLRNQLTRFFSFFAIGYWQRKNIGSLLNPDWSNFGSEKYKDNPSLQTELARIAFSLKETAERVVLVTLPSNERIQASTRAKAISILRNWTDRQPFIDWIDASDMVKDARDYPTIFYGDPHPNKEMHKKFAEKIYNELNLKNRLN